MKVYTGVGSRETPEDIIRTMVKIGKWMGNSGVLLRSGGADGADSAFERGCDAVSGRKEIFYSSNNRGTVVEGVYWKEAEKIASEVHPAWDRCNGWARKLHTRNVFQVMGKDLNSYSDILVCWTKKGGYTGGTATAMRVADVCGVRIFNLFFKDHLEELRHICWK